MRCIVIGLGIQGHKRKYELLKHGEFVCAVDPVNKAAQYRDVIDVPVGDYDAAMVCVPSDQKPEIVDYLLGIKKHMLVEKPLIWPDRWLADVDVFCKEHGVVCYVAYNHRFEPMIVKLRDLIASGELGNLYHCRMFYGNGTAQSVKESPWRDSGKYGVMAELGCHLIDLEDYLFRPTFKHFDTSSGVKVLDYEIDIPGRGYRKFSGMIAHAFENKKFDHAVFSGGEVRPTVHCEVTYLSWKNTFTIDLIGQNGSAHIDGLVKWGESKFTYRCRQFPPGVPSEDVTIIKDVDRTWAQEYAHFKRLCESREHPGLERDRMINRTLESL